MNQVLGKRTAPYRYLAPTIVLMVIFLVIPIINVVRYSFLDKAIVRPDPNFVGLDNYHTLVADDSFWNATGNTVIFVVVSVFVFVSKIYVFGRIKSEPVHTDILKIVSCHL